MTTNTESLSLRLLKSGAIAMTVKLLAAAFSFAMFAALARWLGPEAYGEYAIAFSSGTFMGFVLLAGLNLAVLRTLPTLDQTDADGERSTHVRNAAISLLAICCVAGVAAIAFALVLFALNQGKWAEIAVLTFGFAAAFSFAELLASIFRAVGLVNLALVPRDIAWRLLVLTFAAVAIALGATSGAGGATLITVGLLMACLLAQATIGRKHLPVRGEQAPLYRPSFAILKESRWLALATVTANSLQPLAVVVVGTALSTASSGAFFAAQRTAALLSLPLIAMNIIGAPQIARAWSRDDRNETVRICRQIATTASVGTVIGLLITVALSARLMGVFDPSFSRNANILTILAISNLINALAGPTSVLLQMTGHERQLLLLVGLGQGGGLILVGLGAVTLGLAAAAWAQLLGSLAWNVLIVIWSRINLKVDPSILTIFGGVQRG